MESLSLTVNHDHSLAVLGSRAGIKAHICSNGLWCRGILAPAVTRRVFWPLKASTITVFLPFCHHLFMQYCILDKICYWDQSFCWNLLQCWKIRTIYWWVGRTFYILVCSCLLVDCTLLLCFFLEMVCICRIPRIFQMTCGMTVHFSGGSRLLAYSQIIIRYK